VGVWLAGLGAMFGARQWELFKIAAIKKSITALTEPAEYVRETQKRALALEQYLDRSHSALEILLEISRALPEGLELKSYLYRKGKHVEITGMAVTVNLIYDFKKVMDDSKLFTSVELPGTSRAPDGRESFKITLKMPGEAGG